MNLDQKNNKKNTWKIMLIIVLTFIFIFSVFYDIALSNNGFPFLTTICFLIFIIFRFLKPYLR